MDANGTRFHLLLGKPDWALCTDADASDSKSVFDASLADNDTGLTWDDSRHELTLRPLVFRFPPSPTDAALTPDDRRGAGRDRFGNWYWIDETQSSLLVLSTGSGNVSVYWPAGAPVAVSPSTGDFQPLDPPPVPEPRTLSGLAVTEAHYLVVGVLRPAGLLVFDLHANHPPRFLVWPTAQFVPFDLAPAAGGGVWVLDRENRRVWGLDRQFHVVRTEPVPETHDDFQPTTGGDDRRTPALAFPEGVALVASAPLTVRDPMAVEGLPDGTFLVLDRDTGGALVWVSRYDARGMLGKPVGVPMQGLVDASDGDFKFVAHDFAFVGEHDDPTTGAVPDRIYVAGADGQQALAFDISQEDGVLHLDAPGESAYFPMRLFGGKGLVATGSDAFYDFEDDWLPLRAQRRPRYLRSGRLHTPINPEQKPVRGAFDGHDPGCVWHRLLLDACVPPGTEFRIRSRAADDQRDLAVADWFAEPKPYRRDDGSEQPYLRQAYDTWELLFQAARGRYLQLEIVFVGNGRATPRLRAARVYYPRFSYVERYLPAVYREDRASASFLERYLANPEGTFTAIEDKIAAVQSLFDPRSAPADALDWLASWFGVALDPAWQEDRRRLFLRHAMDFFQYRGTMCGLEMALRLAFDKCADERIFTDTFQQHGLPPSSSNPPVRTAPAGLSNSVRIIERFRTREAPGVLSGDPTDLAGLRRVSPSARWTPHDGRAVLNRRYRDWPRPGVDPGQIPSGFPLQTPPGSEGSTWQQFSAAVLGFVPSANNAHLPMWQAFLTRRYRTVEALMAAYGTALASFTAMPLPVVLPADGPALSDWYQFESVVLAMRRTAHRFTVLLPAPIADTPDYAEHKRRLDWARRVIDLEKPAHTTFDVKFYWALFRVGAVRLGVDTLIDQGSRAPQFRRPMILDRSYLAEGFLTPRPPRDAAVLGRDLLGAAPSRGDI